MKTILLGWGFDAFQQLSAGSLESERTAILDHESSQSECESSNIFGATWSCVYRAHNGLLHVKGNTALLEGDYGEWRVRALGDCNSGGIECETGDIHHQVVDASLSEQQGAVVLDDGRVLLLAYNSSTKRSAASSILGRAVKVACSDFVCAAIDDGGRVWLIHLNGSPELKDLPRPEKAIQVACGLGHVAVLTAAGNVYSCGANAHGQLGLGDVDKRVELEEVEALSGLGISQIACGHWHSSALSASGDVYMWGWDDKLQLGPAIDNERERAIPTAVELPVEAGDVVKVACGSAHTVALTAAGEICLGDKNRIIRNARESLSAVNQALAPQGLGLEQIWPAPPWRSLRRVPWDDALDRLWRRWDWSSRRYCMWLLADTGLMHSFPLKSEDYLHEIERCPPWFPLQSNKSMASFPIGYVSLSAPSINTRQIS